MPVSTEHQQVLAEDQPCVSVPCSRSLPSVLAADSGASVTRRIKGLILQVALVLLLLLGERRVKTLYLLALLH